ncbi:MAG TPA: hypothetical protein VFE18_02265 [Phenylobacterium sp.]|jgi:hypothetical protein|uniref:hypothetical protein n=1 Tax=Phenylobacterium sp. TaxID=1871053 RepID=UPI002D69327B|nr:hypothetical protein [Phenylobacterium sp.]HZZ66973.1 hypothetical protein [Phenylobacterium sp.]
MPLDYGQRRRPRNLRGVWWALVPGVVLIGAILAYNAAGHHRREHEQGWVGSGPPCPTISAAAYRARGYAAHERATVYDEVTFARQFGHMICKDVDTSGGFGFVTHPACQFTSPTALRVRSARGEAFFEPGPGKLATVAVEHGRATCAEGGRFTLFFDPTN